MEPLVPKLNITKLEASPGQTGAPAAHNPSAPNTGHHQEKGAWDNLHTPRTKLHAAGDAAISPRGLRIHQSKAPEEKKAEEKEDDKAIKFVPNKSIPVTVGDVMFRVPIGNAEKRNVRWLATAAARRYAERAGAYSTFSSTSFSPIPTAIRILATGEIIAPTMSISELWSKLVSIASADVELQVSRATKGPWDAETPKSVASSPKKGLATPTAGPSRIDLDTGVLLEFPEEEGYGRQGGKSPEKAGEGKGGAAAAGDAVSGYGTWRGRHVSPVPSLTRTLPGMGEEQDPVPRSPWQEAAFSPSTAANARAVKIATAARDEVLRAEAEAAALAEAQYAQLVAHHLKQLADNFNSADMADGDPSAASAEGAAALLASLDSEWSFIRISSLTTNVGEQLRIKASLAVHWSDLNTLFNHYGSTDSGMEPLGIGSGAGGESGKSLQLAEWIHLCCVAGVCPDLLPLDAIRQVFIVANEDRSSMKAVGGDDGRTDSMSSFEFLEAVILLGNAVYGRVEDPSYGRLGAAGGFQALLHQHLVPLAVWIRTGPLHKQLYHPSMQLWMRPRMGALRAVFAFYSASDAREASAVSAIIKRTTGGGNTQVLGSTAIKYKTGGAAATRHSLSLREFAVLLEHCGLVAVGTAQACAEYSIGIARGKAEAPKFRHSYQCAEDAAAARQKSGGAASKRRASVVGVVGPGGVTTLLPPYDVKVVGIDHITMQPILEETPRAPINTDAPLVYEAFCAAQLPDGHSRWWSPVTGKALRAEEGGKSDDFLDELTFVEAMEAVARVCLARWAYPAGIDRTYFWDYNIDDKKLALKEAAEQRDVLRKAILAAMDDKLAAAAAGSAAQSGGQKKDPELEIVEAQLAAAAGQSVDEKAASKRFRGLLSRIAVQSEQSYTSLTSAAADAAGGAKKPTAVMKSFAELAAEEEAAALAEEQARAPKPIDPRRQRRGTVSDANVFSIGPKLGTRRGSVVADVQAEEMKKARAARRAREAQEAADIEAGLAVAAASSRKLYTPFPTDAEIASQIVRWGIEAVASVAWHLGQPTPKRPLPMHAVDAQAVAREIRARTTSLMASGIASASAAGEGEEGEPGEEAAKPDLDHLRSQMSSDVQQAYSTAAAAAQRGSPQQARGAGGSNLLSSLPAGSPAAGGGMLSSPAALAAREISRNVPIRGDGNPEEGIVKRSRPVKKPFTFSVPVSPLTERVSVPGAKADVAAVRPPHAGAAGDTSAPPYSPRSPRPPADGAPMASSRSSHSRDVGEQASLEAGHSVAVHSYHEEGPAAGTA